MRNQKTTKMVLAAIFIAIILILAFTPGLGYIPLGAIRITTVHIPVILGGIFLGPVYGAVLGGVFGLTSFINNTISPVATSFAFTPFYSIGGVSGGWWSIVICFLPRILIGVVSYYVFILMNMLMKRKYRSISYAVAGVFGSLTNTILVMNLIYFCLGSQYAEATGRSINTLYRVILTIIGVNGGFEAIGAAVITMGVGNVLYRFVRGN